jgi:hypothetical protein
VVVVAVVDSDAVGADVDVGTMVVVDLKKFDGQVKKKKP